MQCDSVRADDQHRLELGMGRGDRLEMDEGKPQHLGHEKHPSTSTTQSREPESTVQTGFGTARQNDVERRE